MRVWVVAGTRKTLHEATQVEGGLQTLEACQKDQWKHSEVYTDLNVALGAAKRHCKRCMRRL